MWNMHLPTQSYNQTDLPVLYKHKYKYQTEFHQKQYYKSKNNNHDNHSKTKKKLKEYDLSEIMDLLKNKMHYLKNIDFDNNEYEYQTVEKEKKKTPIALLNEWAIHNKLNKNNKNVTYTLVAITGYAYKPIFTYMCQVHDKTAKAEGQSKKEAKQNAATRMLEKLFKVDSMENGDITSTTTTDNFEINENNIENLNCTEGSQIRDVTDSEIENKKLDNSKYEAVKIAYYDMNPIGALQELSTSYRWVPPLYNFQKLSTFNKDQPQNVKCASKTMLYKVDCKMFHLLTIGTAKTKKGAKRMAARLMLDQIYEFGIDKLNDLKSSKTALVYYNNSYEKEKKITIQESPLDLNCAQTFRLYFTTVTTAATVNLTTEISSSNTLTENNDNLRLQEEEQYQMDFEQSILQYNPEKSTVDQLQLLCQQLGFKAVYVCVNKLVVQQQKCLREIKNDDSQNKYTVLLQVSTIPVTVTIGQAATVEAATEVAAKSVLQTFKAMLLFTSSSSLNQNNNQENDYCFVEI